MFHLHLIVTGPNKEAVITKIVELVGQSRDEAANIVDKLGIVQRNLERREAQRLKHELTSVGAQVMLIPAGDFTLSPGKPLLLEIQDENNQPIAGAEIRVWTRNKRFDRIIPSLVSDNNGRAFIPQFSDKISRFFEELPPIWFEVERDEASLSTIHRSFSWEVFSEFPETLFLIQVQTSKEIPSKGTHIVKGTVYTSKGVGAANLKVVAVQKSLGKDINLGNVKTDESGKYNIQYSTEDISGENPDLQVKVLESSDEEQELERSSVIYYASKEESLNIILSKDNDPAPAPEYNRLIEALQKHTEGRELAELQENEEQQDITYLANKTGWDARMIAMAVLAHEGTMQTDLPAPLYYALYRAGIPTDSVELNRTNAHTAKKIWKQAIDQNIIDPSFEEQLDNHIRLFKKTSTKTLLQDESSPGVSTMDQMLSLSLSDENKKREFAERYLNQNPDEENFWNGIEDRFGADLKHKLQLDGKLGVLTSNNAPLIKKLRDEQLVADDPVELVQNGFYAKSAWLTAMQDGNIPLPEDLPGESIDDKRQQYAKAMSGHLKMSYPTAVLGQQVKREELPLIDGETRTDVANFLQTHQKDFAIGEKPLLQYLKEKEIDIDEPVAQELKRLERVYQISASDESYKVLLENNIDSAHEAARIGKKGIVHKLKSAGISEDEANLVSEKILHVQGTVMNVVTGYTTYLQTPPIYALNHLHPLYGRGENGEREGILAYPKLEELLGEMDFCECKHCRSVLSPAAYLVEILQFINKNPGDFENVSGENPFDVLMKRRPDIEHIQLTCENTNTVLPYIDLVNEILEHYVVNGSPDDFEGYNNEGDITTEELLANPQFVKTEAYKILNQQVYPLQLPFNQPLAALRRLFEHLELPLYRAMTTLRVNDDAATWKNIHMEYLRISPEEYAILTKNEKTLEEYYGETAGANLESVLSANDTYAKDLTRKVDITYKGLTRIVKTQFINPARILITKLENLQVGMGKILAFIEGDISDSAFNNLLLDDLNTEHFDEDVKSWIQERGDVIKRIIFLIDPSEEADECSFEQLALRHGDGTPIEALDYFKIMRFIRLWKKMGWTIEQTDKTITALWNNLEEVNDIEELNTGFVSLITKIAHLQKVMELLDIKPNRELLKVLALFGSIDTYGRNSLYHQKFLNTTLQEIDEVFQGNSSDEYLNASNVKVLDHEAAVLAAFNLSSKKLRLILNRIKNDLGLNEIEDVPLTLDNVTSIHRYSYLSRQLELSIEEVLLLQELTGIDPFAGLEEIDPGIIQFIELVQRINNSDFTIPQLTYFLRHEDLTGEASPNNEEILAVAKQIKDELQRVENENSTICDPTGEVLRSKMVQVYDPSVVDQFFSIVNNDISFNEEQYDHHVASLESELREVTDKLGYNHFQKILSFEGIMTSEQKAKLENAAGIIPEANNARSAFIIAIESLFNQGQATKQAFFGKHPQLETPYNKFKVDNNFEQLLIEILNSFKIRVKNMVVRQTLADALGIEIERTTALLNDSSVLKAVSEDSSPSIEDYMALETNGVSGVYTFQDDSTEEHLLTNINTTLEDHQLPDSRAVEEVSYTFYTEVIEKAFYNFRLETEDGADISFFLDQKEVVGTNNNGIWDNSEPVELGANQLHHFKIVLTDITDKVILKWVSENGPSDFHLLSDSKLYPGQTIQAFKQSYLRFLKALTLLESLEITNKEIRHLNDVFQIDGAGFLNAIPVGFNPEDTEHHKNLMNIIVDLLRFKAIKEGLEAKGDDLIAVLDDPTVTYTDSQEEERELLLKVTGWEKSNLEVLLREFGLAYDDLSDIDNFYRTWAALRIVDTAGLPASKLLESTTNTPDRNTVATLQHAIRIKYDERAWLSVIQPINDNLRNIQRDALVDYVLRLMQQNEGTKMIDTIDKLFEYFLIDVAMDSCMKTSRIKQAISSVQLFIHRCLLNLEQQPGDDSGVDPAIINGKQWEWMKRYRVWEANRKVFLQPENWLEPELRDNKSPFFQELESELLQSDITEDRARTLLLNYLEKLDEVAKLDIAGMCMQENQILEDGAYKSSDDVVHIFGKTQGKGSKYYYRRFEGGYFTPWEKVDLDIEGDPILPVIWKDRLFLFWLNIIQKGNGNKDSAIQTKSGESEKLTEALFDPSASKDNGKIIVEISLSWSEYFNGKWQPRRISDINEPATLTNLEALKFKRGDIKLSHSKTKNMWVGIDYEKTETQFFSLRNKYTAYLNPSPPRLGPKDSRSIEILDNKLLEVSYKGNAGTTYSFNYSHIILSDSNYSESIQPIDFSSLFHTPFFIINWDHVFFVQLRESYVPIVVIEDYGLWNNGFVNVEDNLSTPIVGIAEIDLDYFAEFEKAKIKDPIIGIDNPGWTDPSPIEREFMDSRIKNALLSKNAILFRGRVIGASISSTQKDLSLIIDTLFNQ